MSEKKAFIPTNKPKSFVVAHLAVLVGLFVAAPVIVVGSFYDIGALATLGNVLFFFCWLLGFTMGFKYYFGFLSGKYSDMKDQDWKNQPW